MQIHFDEKEDKILHKMSEVWKISKMETAKKMIREFRENNKNEE